MRAAWWIAVGVMAAIEGSAAAKGGAILVPPVEVDVGATAPVGGAEASGPSIDVLVGVHWASLAWHPTSFEIGVGYVGSFRPLRPGYRTGIAERTTGPATTDDRFTLSGGYLTLGKTLINEPHFRTWIEARGELLRGTLPDRSFSAVGGALRFSAELFATTLAATGDHSGFGMIAGTAAIGIYIEASHREIASELGPTGVTTGISVRIPFVFIVAS